ncbi:MAG: zinc ABC transporter substrate-binding protein [Gammaproteobacteria bacterium]|nr:zinc ABC transporter substrate-binding protein [Gammaproteobacteria bacterium]
MSISRILSIALALFLFSGTAQAQVNIFTCEPEWAALAGEIAGDRAKITSATTALQDVHHIQARPSLIARARRADLLFCTGAELEVGWLPMLLRKANNPRIQPGNIGHLMATDHVELLDKRDQVDRSEGDIHAAGNPHIQTNPHKLIPVALELSKRLGQIDPDNAQVYSDRFDAFEQKFSAAIQGWEARAEPLRGRKMVTHHRSWIYLQDWLGMEGVGTLESKPGIPPSSRHLSQLLSEMGRSPADMIIYASYQDDSASNWLSSRSGIPEVKLPISVGGTDAATDLFGFYDDLIDRMLSVIK